MPYGNHTESAILCGKQAGAREGAAAHSAQGAEPRAAFWMQRFAAHHRAAEDFTALALLVRPRPRPISGTSLLRLTGTSRVYVHHSIPSCEQAAGAARCAPGLASSLDDVTLFASEPWCVVLRTRPKAKCAGQDVFRQILHIAP